MRVWDLASAEEGVVDDPLALAGYRSHVWAVAFDARDRVMSVTADGIVRTWPSSTDALRQALWRASPHCLAVDRKGRTRDSPVDAQRSY